MIENQQNRDLSEVEIGAMNDCKALAVEVGVLYPKVAGIEEVDQRWLAIARTDLQKGFMALVRSIARPTTF